MIITGRERYSWLVPIGLRSAAHAFVPGAKHSLCLKVERFAVGQQGYAREDVGANEPKRARCPQCKNILGHKDNKNMREVEEV